MKIAVISDDDPCYEFEVGFFLPDFVWRKKESVDIGYPTTTTKVYMPIEFSMQVSKKSFKFIVRFLGIGGILYMRDKT